MKKETILKNRKGYTLIELIVVFTMIGIFMASMTTVAVSYMRTFLRVTAMGKTQIAADTVMETIAGELSAAADRPIVKDGIRQDTNLEVSESEIYYVNQNGQTIHMEAEDGILHLKYLEVKADSSGPGSAAADWYISKKAYQGAAVKSLRFEKVEDKSLVKVTLTMSNDKVDADYEFETGKYIELYNLREKESGGTGG